MKKTLAAIIATTFIAQAITTTLQAQPKADVPISLSDEGAATLSAGKEAKANANASRYFLKAKKDFSQSYPAGKNAYWLAGNDGSIDACYTEAGVRNDVYYDTHGQWASLVKRYTANNMSEELRLMVMPNYYNYAITHITEIHTISSTVYLVNIESKSTLKTIRVCNGEMEEIASYKNGGVNN